MRYFVLLLAGALCGVSCKKSGNSGNGGPTDTALVGTWRWVVTYESSAVTNGNPADIASFTLTPATTGFQETLILRVNNSFSIVRSNGTGSSGVYGYSILLSPGGPIRSLFFDPSGGVDTVYNHSIQGDTLDLNNMQVSAGWFNRLYVRESLTGD